jgi:Domain of unknown function (DUF3458_C) ARM repeats
LTLTGCQPRRWDAAQRLAKKLLLDLYSAATGADVSDSKAVDGALAAAGGVSDSLVAAYRSILEDKIMDGSTAAITLSLPSQSELVQARRHLPPSLFFCCVTSSAACAAATTCAPVSRHQ